MHGPREGGGAAWRRLAQATVAILLLWAAGCLPDASGPPAAGDPAPAFSGETLEGDSLSLAELEGRPVLLNVWATWCTPCRVETPFFQSLHEEFSPRGLEIVGVSVDVRGARREIDRFLEEFGVEYRIVHDPESRIMDRYAVPGLPSTYLIDPEGRIRLVRLGLVSEEDEEFLQALEDLVT